MQNSLEMAGKNSIQSHRMELITNTFVLVAPDCPLATGMKPLPRGAKPTIPLSQYEFLIDAPYEHTLEELMFAVYVRREGLSESDAKAQSKEIRAKLFDKPYPCMRASPLPKSYGWGVHHDAKGKIAIYGVDTEEYLRLVGTSGLDIVTAMRSSRA